MVEFLSMGGYARFVWPAFAVAAVMMAVLALVSRRTLRARQAELEALRRARAAEPATAGPGDRDEA